MKPYYQDEAVTIYHGDCREIVPTLGRFDALVTDPPYGIGFGKKPSALKPNAKEYASFDDSYENWLKCIPPRIREVLAVCDRGAVFCAYQRIWDLPVCDALGAVTTDCSSSRSSWGFCGLFPILLYGVSPSLAKRRGAVRTTLHDNSMRIPKTNHPCVKPMSWMRWLVSLASDNGDTIIDPFAGSGTTGRAAKDLGRKAVLIEIEESYCEIAADRMRQEVLPLVESEPQEPKQGELTL